MIGKVSLLTGFPKLHLDRKILHEYLLVDNYIMICLSVDYLILKDNQNEQKSLNMFFCQQNSAAIQRKASAHQPCHQRMRSPKKLGCGRQQVAWRSRAGRMPCWRVWCSGPGAGPCSGRGLETWTCWQREASGLLEMTEYTSCVMIVSTIKLYAVTMWKSTSHWFLYAIFISFI